MTVRADWALELQLEQTKRESQHDEVHGAIAAVLGHMRSGKGRNRRGGQELIKRLEIARLRASEENERHVVRLIQDALDYSEGRTLKPEFEERFRLFQDGKRDELKLNYLRRNFWVASRYVPDRGREILNNRPEISAREFLEELVSDTDDGQFA